MKVLALDFGTVASAASYLVDGDVQPIVVAGETFVSSAIAWDPEGERLVAGRKALQLPRRLPPSTDTSGLLELMPKTYLNAASSSLVLTDGRSPQVVQLVEVVAAVLEPLVREATSQFGAPDVVVMTHPVEPKDHFQAVLTEVCGRLLPDVDGPLFMVEPVAAVGLLAEPSSGPVALLDFGGGTVDLCVLHPEGGAWTVAGPPMGNPECGGRHMDDKVRGFVKDELAVRDPDGRTFLDDRSEPRAALARLHLDEEVERSKRQLSYDDFDHVNVLLREGYEEIEVRRERFEQLIGPMVTMAVDLLFAAIDRAGFEAQELSGIHLVGGASQVPLVRHTVEARLSEEGAPAELASLSRDPKRVVSGGATVLAAASLRSPDASSPAPDPAPVEAPAPTKPAGVVGPAGADTGGGFADLGSVGAGGATDAPVFHEWSDVLAWYATRAERTEPDVLAFAETLRKMLKAENWATYWLAEDLAGRIPDALDLLDRLEGRPSGLVVAESVTTAILQAHGGVAMQRGDEGALSVDRIKTEEQVDRIPLAVLEHLHTYYRRRWDRKLGRIFIIQGGWASEVTRRGIWVGTLLRWRLKKERLL